MLIIALPLHTEGAATEYLHVRAGPGAATGHAQSATAARLPRDAGTVVAVVPAQALAWHTITPPPVGAARLAAACWKTRPSRKWCTRPTAPPPPPKVRP